MGGDVLMKVKLITTAVVSTIAAAAMIATPAFAWHPKGTIIKYVQNQTTGSAMSDANDTAHAVAAKPGDLLKYTIVVSNTGTPASNGNNDMASVVMKDTLPTGVELVSNASSRQISVNMGTIKPGAKVTKEYVVKVTASKDSTIENKACFTGDSTVKDNPQSGCDVAIIKVSVPVTPVTPVTPVQPVPPTTPVQPETPVVLPTTGPADLLVGASGIATLGYAVSSYVRSRGAVRTRLS
jgi:uncharacterized repeat protein (TIGR01451 family)